VPPSNVSRLEFEDLRTVNIVWRVVMSEFNNNKDREKVPGFLWTSLSNIEF